jgi:hypothetical protein
VEVAVLLLVHQLNDERLEEAVKVKAEGHREVGL